MGAEREREAVKAQYKNRYWQKKVDAMTDEQVVAIYLRLKQQRKAA